MERSLSRLGSRVAEATEKAFSTKKQIEEAIVILMDMQTEIADLYEQLDDLLPF